MGPPASSDLTLRWRIKMAVAIGVCRLVSIFPVIGHPVSPIMKRNTCKRPLLPGRQNFFDPFPGTALKHEVLQVKLCAHAICRCE